MKGIPRCRMFPAGEGPIALLMDPNLRTAFIGPDPPHTVFVVEVCGDQGWGVL